MSTDILHILYNSTEVGRLEYQRKRDEMILVYEESWRFGTKSFPISLSLPLEKQRHADGFILKRKMNHNRSAAEMAGLTVLNLSGK
jgi:HipA-like protein